MVMSKKWTELSPEEKTIKRKEYRETYEKKHPDRVIEQTKRYKDKYKDRLRLNASTWQKEKGRLNKLKAIEYLGGKCVDCGQKFPPYIYDFHHINPEIKEFSITKIMGRTWEKIIPELDKCVLLCSNCHRTRHHNENY